MEPTKCLNDILLCLLAASKADTEAEAMEHIEDADMKWGDLMGWLKMRGFPPHVRLNAGSNADWFIPTETPYGKHG